MPHKTAALMRFSSGSQAAALGNCKVPPGLLATSRFPFFAMRPVYWDWAAAGRGTTLRRQSSSHNFIKLSALVAIVETESKLVQEPSSGSTRLAVLRLARLPVMGHQRGFE